MSKDSNMVISISISECRTCNKTFSELEDYPLPECPYCGETDNIEENYLSRNIGVSVDYKTGEPYAYKVRDK